MILLINTCSKKLSEHEFVRPVAELVKDCEIRHFKKLGDLDKFSKIIICGTALKDFDYLNADWSWIKNYKGKLLGLCAGYQVIAKELGEHLEDHKIIGVKNNHYFLISKLLRFKVFLLRIRKK